MSSQIERALVKLFDRHRIVFWYDAKQELRDDFEALQLPGVEKLELINNEYGIKYKLLREQPEQKFLLYRECPQPADLDNWLLDVQLAHDDHGQLGFACRHISLESIERLRRLIELNLADEAELERELGALIEI